MPIDRDIGLDAYSSSCTVAIVGLSGRHLASHVVETRVTAWETVVHDRFLRLD